MNRLTIDGIEVQVEAGTTILDAARSAGVDIPTLCYLRDVSAVGSCRVCSVEVEGSEGLVPACNTLAQDGMAVITDSRKVIEYRKIALDLILADHGLASIDECRSCFKDGTCDLQRICRECGIDGPAFAPPHPSNLPVVDDNPFLSYDPNLCISCQRCVGACNEVARNHTLQAGKRGVRTTIEAPFGPDWKATDCEQCGNCAAACPTGALVEKCRRDYRDDEVKRVLTTCPHCAVGCQYYLMVKDNKIVNVEAALGASNRWRLCVKGRSASYDFVDAPDRLRTPLVRNATTGELEPATWDEALDLVAERFGDIKRRHGGEALAAFACSRSTNEDIYLLQKMARTAFRTNNVDNCARV